MIEVVRALLLPVEAIDTPEGSGLEQFVWRKSLLNSSDSSCAGPVGDETDQVCSSSGVGTDGYDVDSEYYGLTKISGEFLVLPLLTAGYYSGSTGTATANSSDAKLVPNVGYSWWSGHINNEHAIRGTVEPTEYSEEDVALSWDWSDSPYGNLAAILRDKPNVPEGMEEVGCMERMFVEFKTLRAISEGEELVVDVEVDKATGFKYLMDAEFSSSCL